MVRKNIQKLEPTKFKSLDEVCQDFSATQILYLLGETLLNEIDKNAEIIYDESKEPHYFKFNMQNGRNIGVVVMEIKPLIDS